MIARILLIAIAAGVIAGLSATLVQSTLVTPLILEAEEFEHGATPEAGSHGSEDAAAGQVSAWAPADGLPRWSFTALADILIGAGYGLLLVAAIVLRGRSVDPARGVLWGMAGFAVFSLAPALGLPPELPGTEAAALGARQVWWLATVAATCLGLAAIVFTRNHVLRGLGVALIALPHIVGAPFPASHGGTAPAALAAEFAIVSMVSAAIFWAVLGGTSGLLFSRLAPLRR